MGLEIGAAPSVLAVTRERTPYEGTYAPPFARSPRNREETPESFRSQTEEGAALFGRERQPAPRIGFGEGTVMPSGEAVRTMGTNLRFVRGLIDSVQRKQADDASSTPQDSDAASENLLGVSGKANLSLERAAAEKRVAAQTRSLINGMNQAAEIALARTQGSAPTDAGGAARVSPAMDRQQVSYQESRPIGQLLNLLA
ncbi:MAG TPA: hypothetical protein PLO62_03805 [Candidatus Hydrogenedentes bacterium]|nr:hypothetical protein [Candidatus Hydrogenedentota bacterium]